MAVTVTHVKHNSAGSFYEHVCDVAGPASYNTGGETLTAAEVTALMPKLGNCVAADWAKIQSLVSETNSTGLRLALDRVAGKLMWFSVSAQLAGAASAAAPTRVTVRYGNAGD